ncbi:NAD-dependent epimerase/dehydratase family protein [Nostoc commune]|uniref:NAD-dependent epimerase/dehydratase family protein n=1 Tax=Nostoc commune TaxID=1178 RepID=UPI0018C6E5FD|nr:NAD-dependent epimerase/dehydratase family protein [Nostoc commune]MBG1261236.1 NAD(P)H-binding protein [Nostoc commune BAE]
MNVLVIGGTGLIGWHAVLELCTRGHQVRILARRPPQEIALHDEITYVSGDYLQGDLSSAFDGIEGIIFAAGTDYRQVPRGSAWDFFRRTNVEIPASLFQQAEKAGVQRGVFVTSYYHVVAPELIPDHPYIHSRAESEEVALNACGRGLNLSIIQPSWVIGLGFARHLSLSGTYTKWVHSFAPLFGSPGGTNFVAATSLAHAIVTALESGKHGDRFLIGDENILWTDLLERFAHAAGRQGKVHTIPKGLIHGSATTTALFLRLLGYESGLELHKWSRFFTKELYFDPSPAQQVLKYPIGKINQSIAKVVGRNQTNAVLHSSVT